MSLALDEPNEHDVVLVINGIKVAMDDRVAPFTQNVTLDFKETPSGAGLVITGANDCC